MTAGSGQEIGVIRVVEISSTTTPTLEEQLAIARTNAAMWEHVARAATQKLGMVMRVLQRTQQRSDN